MNRLITSVLALTALAASQAVLANTQLISCHGCSSYAKSQAASQATSQGKVLVFDQQRAVISTYAVHTEMLDMRPRTTWTEARLVKTDPTLQKRYEKFVAAYENVAEMGTIVLPPDFEYGSVADAILDPAGSTTAIEDYIANVNRWHFLNQATMNLASRVTQLDFGVIDFSEVVTGLLLKIEFPDSSDMSYNQSYSINPGNSDVRLELTVFGNAHTADGRALPTHLNSLRGRTFNSHNGSIFHWINYVRALGARVRGAENGGEGLKTRMVCTVKGSHLECEVIIVE